MIKNVPSPSQKIFFWLRIFSFSLLDRRSRAGVPLVLCLSFFLWPRAVLYPRRAGHEEETPNSTVLTVCPFVPFAFWSWREGRGLPFTVDWRL